MQILDNEVQASSSSSQVLRLHSSIEEMERLFALKMMAKHMLPRDVINDMLNFCEDIHSIKVDCIISQLKSNFGSENSVEIKKVTDSIQLHDNVIGLKDQLLTDFKRTRHLKNYFKFVEPVPVLIKKVKDQSRDFLIEEVPDQPHFYYRLPLRETIARLLSDDSLRRHD